jgi:hypothetical protein
MNLLLDFDNINNNNVCLTDTKPNMMFDGTFTKLLYCDELFTMYGIHLNVPIRQTIPRQITDTMYHNLMQLELNILNLYIRTQSPKCSTVTYKLCETLKTKFSMIPQLQDGIGSSSVCLKISGVWENNHTNEIGLSFKFH